MDIRSRFTFSIISMVICMTCAGCSFPGSGSFSGPPGNQASGPDNLFNIPAQIIAGDSIRSIQFHREGNPTSAPILNLNSSNRLSIRFEHLSFESKQFRISLTHHNPDWSRSGLPPERFIEGFNSIPLNGGQVSSNTRLAYRQYSFTFPTDQFRITRSGNYLLKVEDTDNGYLVFSLPFFVTENEGSLTSSVEEIPVPRQNLRRVHRLISRYTLPEYVEQPQFDLEFYFTQNRFWGRSKKARELDFSAPDHVQFELSREQSFIGDYEFRILSLNRLSQVNNQVAEAFPAEIPPRLILKDDAEGFGNSRAINLSQFGPFGRPDMSLNAGYANVVFRFDPDSVPDSTASIYLLGDFNNWSVNSSNRLYYDKEIDRWTTSAIIKQGVYKYKYVLVDGDKIDDLYFDELFTDNRQQYHSFVYMRDPKEFYYRLLQVHTFFSE